VTGFPNFSRKSIHHGLYATFMILNLFDGQIYKIPIPSAHALWYFPYGDQNLIRNQGNIRVLVNISFK
jgi:hypothetical protein